MFILLVLQNTFDLPVLDHKMDTYPRATASEELFVTLVHDIQFPTNTKDFACALTVTTPIPSQTRPRATRGSLFCPAAFLLCPCARVAPVPMSCQYLPAYLFRTWHMSDFLESATAVMFGTWAREGLATHAQKTDNRTMTTEEKYMRKVRSLETTGMNMAPFETPQSQFPCHACHA